MMLRIRRRARRRQRDEAEIDRWVQKYIASLRGPDAPDPDSIGVAGYGKHEALKQEARRRVVARGFDLSHPHSVFFV